MRKKFQEHITFYVETTLLSKQDDWENSLFTALDQ